MIQANIGDASASSEIVNEWYKKINNRNISIFNEYSTLHLSFCELKDPFDSLLMIDTDYCFNAKMFTKDGRFLVFPYWNLMNQCFIVIYDLFHGTKK